jgi:hypothetical protein
LIAECKRAGAGSSEGKLYALKRASRHYHGSRQRFPPKGFAKVGVFGACTSRTRYTVKRQSVKWGITDDDMRVESDIGAARRFDLRPL